MSETIRRSGSPYGPDGPSSADIIRSRWISNGMKFTEEQVQAAAKATDESLQSPLKKKPPAPAESIEEEIHDAWEQDREEKAATSTAGDWIDDFKNMDWSGDLGQEEEEKKKCWEPPVKDEPRAAASAPNPVVQAIEAALRQHRPRRPAPTRRLPHGSCTGVWIPKAVYEDLRFESHSEMILYLEVNHLDQEEGCKAKNKHFANYLGCSVQTVQDMIRAMTERGIFICSYPNRRSRVIHIAGGRKDYSRHRG